MTPRVDVGDGAAADGPAPPAGTLPGLAGADAILGREFPLPGVALPVARWVEVRALGDAGAQVEWNLDDSRDSSPGRLALYAGSSPAPPQLPAGAPGGQAAGAFVAGHHVHIVRLALAEAEPSLRPVVELTWEAGGLHLRLTAQGPWRLEDVLAIAGSIRPTGPDGLG